MAKGWSNAATDVGGMQSIGDVTLLAPPLTPEESARQMRATLIEQNWAAYLGVFPDSLEIKRPRTLQERPLNFNVKVSAVQGVVEELVSKLFGKGVNLTIDDGGNDDDKNWLDAFWKANKPGIFLHNLGLMGSLSGIGAIKMVPAQLGPGAVYPRLVLLDSANLDIITLPNDVGTVMEYRDFWEGTSPDGRPALFRQVTSRAKAPAKGWVVQDQMLAGKDWIPQTEALPWPYDFCPIEHCQNMPFPRSPWGLPDINALYVGMNHVINFILSNGVKIVYYQGHQRLWAKGYNNNEQRGNPEDIITLNMQPESTLQAIQGIANLQAVNDLHNILAAYMAKQVRVPSAAQGDAAGEIAKSDTSGIAMAFALAPLLSKTDTKQAVYGDLLERIATNALALAGKTGRVVACKFPNPLPVNRLQEAQTAAAWQAAGVSKETTLEEADYNPQQEAERRKQEQAEATPPQLAGFTGGNNGNVPNRPQPGDAGNMMQDMMAGKATSNG